MGFFKKSEGLQPTMKYRASHGFLHNIKILEKDSLYW